MNARLSVTAKIAFNITVAINADAKGVASPKAEFAISPTDPGVGQQVFFDANASAASPGRSIARYDWDFGDGYFGSGVTESHRYTRAGAFVITLTVTDSAGRTGTVSKSLTIDGGGVTTTAAFTVSPTAIRAGQVAFFDAAVSTVTAGRTITRYEWNFGDNQIVEGPRVEHVFSPAGSYTVTLTVTDSGGARAVKTQAITVAP